MFREMRRNKQELSAGSCIEVLNRGTSGVLAVAGDDDYPYAVPLSYVYHDDKLYFHCATSGHKLDALQRNPKASFCVVDQDEVAPAEYTTHYRSVIVFGTLRVLEGEEKREALTMIAAKYSPEQAEGRTKAVESSLGRVCMLELQIQHMSGKQAKELAAQNG